MQFTDVSLAILTLYALSATVFWISALGLRLHAAVAARPAQHDDAGMPEDADHREVGNPPLRCPITGRPCEGDRAHLCADYGCARKAGLSPHSAENL